MSMAKSIAALKGGVVVSCQALPDEPLHSSMIMARMALAAAQGGAVGIRANTAADIAAIGEQTDLPIIGIVKRDYPDSEVFITATMREVDELMTVAPEVIAIDARDAQRPQGERLDDFVSAIRQRYPNVALMADCASLAEMQRAEALGFDLIGTTLVGYTAETQGQQIEHDDFALIRAALDTLHTPIIAEGNINTPEKVRRVLELGVFSVVVGSAITRPQWITAQFVAATALPSRSLL